MRIVYSPTNGALQGHPVATVAMLSHAEAVAGQGVGSAYREMFNLVTRELARRYEFIENPAGHELASCDIVHAHSVNPTIFLKMARLKRRGGIPLVASVHFLPETLEGSIRLPGPAGRVFERYVLEFYRLADHLVTVNPQFVDKLVDLGFERSRVHFVPNYVDRSNFVRPTVPQQVEACDEFGVCPGRFTVLGVGQVQTRKGIHDFLDVARACPELTFVWAGGFSFGPITDGYRELSQAIENAPSNVRFLGIVKRDHMPLLYAAADVLFVPSYAELFPMTILEAFAAGLPVLVRDLDLYRAIVSDYVLTAQDNESFERVLHTLAGDKRELDRAAALSRAGAEKYGPASVSAQWAELYGSLLDEKFRR